MAKYVDSAGLTKAFELIKGSISSKQDALVSGTNIKTINNTSLLGSGNISISGGGGGGITLDDVYPVGSIYMSVNSTDPGTLFGGQWTRLEDVFLLGAGTNHAVGNATAATPTKDGGGETHYHTTGDHKLAANESGVPAHAHPLANSSIVYNSSATGRMATSGSGTKISVNTNVNLNTYDNTAAAAAKAHNHGNTGDGSSMPPYLAVYMWKRTS